MSRKKVLHEKVIQILNNDNKNSFSTRQHRQFSMKRIIDDLFCLRIVPISWYGLQTEHVHKLVSFWQQKGLQNATIMNYLVDLRYFLELINHTVIHIDNKSLRLAKHRNHIKPSLEQEQFLTQINEPIASLLLSFQILFGLTYSEAIHIIPQIHIGTDGLWITREISSNHKDRVVPVFEKSQKNLISFLMDVTLGTHSLKTHFGETHLRLAYKFALSSLKLSTQISYRYLYAKNRFKSLVTQMTAYEAKQMVIAETHISKTSPLWKNIHE